MGHFYSEAEYARASGICLNDESLVGMIYLYRQSQSLCKGTCKVPRIINIANTLPWIRSMNRERGRWMRNEDWRLLIMVQELSEFGGAISST